MIVLLQSCKCYEHVEIWTSSPVLPGAPRRKLMNKERLGISAHLHSLSFKSSLNKCVLERSPTSPSSLQVSTSLPPPMIKLLSIWSPLHLILRLILPKFHFQLLDVVLFLLTTLKSPLLFTIFSMCKNPGTVLSHLWTSSSVGWISGVCHHKTCFPAPWSFLSCIYGYNTCVKLQNWGVKNIPPSPVSVAPDPWTPSP